MFYYTRWGNGSFDDGGRSSMNTSVNASLADQPDSEKAEIKRSFKLLGFFLPPLLLMLVAIWFMSPAVVTTHTVKHEIAQGETLAALVGFENALDVAKAQGIKLDAKLISPVLSPDDARRLITGHGTDVVSVTARIHPGSLLTWDVYDNGDHKGQIVRGSVIYTRASH